MTTRSEIMSEIARMAERIKPMPVETSLLGAVPYHINESANVVGCVPEHIECMAREHGLEVLPPDPRRNVYVFRKNF